jgi:hypothetical protein
MYAQTSIPLESLTLATFLCAELGFLGVCTVTFKQTPLLKGAGIATFLLCFNLLIPNCKAGDLDFLLLFFLFCLISWLMVGIDMVFHTVKNNQKKHNTPKGVPNVYRKLL